MAVSVHDGIAAARYGDVLMILWQGPSRVERIRWLPRSVQADEALEDEGRGFELEELRRLSEVGPTGKSVRSWWPLIATMAWTGLRFGEATALEWRDLDEQEGILRIRRAQWRGIVGHPKAKASKRKLALPDDLRELLRTHRQNLIACSIR
jgi:integrase